ncbi:hypothetical protein AGMMS50293_14540 [Spirochaetia bacterium]|nr:hypothetical protein AGMMS50293_14540 [Spirochaetia bacterium]
MDIQAAATNMSQTRMQEEAAIRVEAMSLNAMKEQSAALDKLLQSAQVITDPTLGNSIDISA